MISRLLSALLVVVAVIYPVLVYLGLQYFDMRMLGLLLAALFILRLLLSPSNKGLAYIIAITGGGLALASSLMNSPAALKFYPVLVSLLMLFTFAHSLLRGPSMVERFARLRETQLPAEAIIYTRKVTWIWCIFFIINGSIALWTALFASMQTWTLYNGAISYVLMGCLFAGEWLYRTQILKLGQV